MLTRWDPFRELTVLQDRINRVFNDQLSRSESEASSMKTWAPVVDILETEVDLLVRVELPGMSREDIDIEVTSDQLTVKGERRLAETEKNNFIRLESPHGPFQRSFSIGVPVQPDKVTASHNGGVLEIVIPKAEEVRPKKIDITTG